MKVNISVFFLISYCFSFHSHLELEKIPGWCSREKADALYSLIVKNNLKASAEIGIYYGATTFVVCSGYKRQNSGCHYAIDSWKTSDCIKGYMDGDPTKKFWEKEDLEKAYRHFLTMLNEYKLGKYCTIIKRTASSRKAINQVGPLDLLIIDGNHSDEEMLADLENYYPKLKVGGYLVLDDILHYDYIRNRFTSTLARQYLSFSVKSIALLDRGNCLILQKAREHTPLDDVRLEYYLERKSS